MILGMWLRWTKVVNNIGRKYTLDQCNVKRKLIESATRLSSNLDDELLLYPWNNRLTILQIM